MCLAIAAKLESRDGDRGVGVLDDRTFEISLVTVPGAVPGDYVLVSLGMALTVISESEAQMIRQAWTTS